MSWIIVRDTTGRWSMEASRLPEKKPDVFYKHSDAINECRKRNKGRVAPTSDFDALFGPLDDVEVLK